MNETLYAFGWKPANTTKTRWAKTMLDKDLAVDLQSDAINPRYPWRYAITARGNILEIVGGYPSALDSMLAAERDLLNSQKGDDGE